MNFIQGSNVFQNLNDRASGQKQVFAPFITIKRQDLFYFNTETGAYTCFSCGKKGGDIISFTQNKYDLTFKEALGKLQKEWGSMTTNPLFQLINETQSNYVAHWLCTEHGRETIAIARYHDYKNDKTYRQFFNDGQGWKLGLPPLPYPLYGLNSLHNKFLHGGILICEGEKCAKVLHQLNWPAVSTILGAGNVSKSDFTPLRYFKRFIILRDNDPAGIEYALNVATEIRRFREDAEIFVCNLSPNEKEDDLIDWLMKAPLYGQKWNGFDNLEKYLIEPVSGLSLFAFVKQ